MSIDIVLITHENVGNALIDSAKTTLNRSLEHVFVVPINPTDDPDIIYAELHKQLATFQHEGDDVLILTDLFGATPCNIAQRLLNDFTDKTCAVVTGLNLPMLLKVLNYQALPLHELSEKAVIGGKEGVSICKCQR